MKKLFTALLCHAMLLTLFGCAANPQMPPADESEPADTATTTSVSASASGSSSASASSSTSTDATTKAPSVSTGDGKTAAKTTTKQTTVTTTTKKQDVLITVISGGKAVYSYHADSAIRTENAEALSYLNRILQEKYGARLAVSSRTQGKVIEFQYAGSHMLDRAITIDEQSGKITISAASTEAMDRAIYTFIAKYCQNNAADLVINASEDYTYSFAKDEIDNSKTISYQKPTADTVSPSDEEGYLYTPNWLDSAVMVEVRISTASIGGTFAEAKKLVDFYAKTGVNVFWITPIYEGGPGGNGYGNIGPHSVEPGITGTKDYDEGWQVVKKFVDYAHSKGIYVLLDVITWGVMKGTEITQEHPTWIKGETWGNAAFNWQNAEFREWYISTVVKNIEVTGADGYRCDCEPNYAGYDVWKEVRHRLNQKGIYPVIMSEDGAERRGSFDCEQDGVLLYSHISRGGLYANPINFFADGILNIVTDTLSGRGLGSQSLQNKHENGIYRYYTNCITNHDYCARDVAGNRLNIGYAAIYAPYIPLWYMGDEFGVKDQNGVLYDFYVDYSLVENFAENALFYEDVKQMLAIRRAYPEIFNYYPIDHTETNICEVTANGLGTLENYARYAGNRAVIVLANNSLSTSGVCQVNIPFEKMFTKNYKTYVVTDLLTGEVLVSGTQEEVDRFCAIVPYEYCGAYLVEGK